MEQYQNQHQHQYQRRRQQQQQMINCLLSKTTHSYFSSRPLISLNKNGPSNHINHHHLTILIFTMTILLLSFQMVNTAKYFDYDDFDRKVSQKQARLYSF